MKGLATLIKLHQRELDQRRRRLAFLESRRDGLVTRLATLEARLEVEQTVAAGSEEALFAYGGYAARHLAEKAALEGQIAKTEEEVAEARTLVGEAHAEVKKYELAQEARARRAQDAIDRAERIELDEVGVEMHRRRKDGAV